MSEFRRAIFWSAVDRFGHQGVQFVLYTVLARLLSPVEYGLIGMLSIFLGVALIFADSGVSTGLIQRTEITPDDETSVFWLNIGTGILLTVLLCGVAPAVADFYHQPILRPLLRVLSLQFVLSAFSNVPCALLMRGMDFRRLTLIGTSSVIIAGITAITLASAGWGVWSLVGQTLAASLSRMVMVAVFARWRPRGRFRWASIRAIWRFSGNLLCSGLIYQVFENLYNATIGKVYSAADLGCYTRANQMQSFTSGTITGIVNRISFPLFSRLQSDPAALLGALRRVIRLTLIPTCFVLIALAVAADQVVVLLLTEKWRPCVPMVRVLAVCGVLFPLHVLHLSALTAVGRSGLFLGLEVAKRALQAVLLAVTWRLGVMSMVWGYMALNVISYFINSFYNIRLLGYTWRRQASDTMPILAVGAVAALAATTSATLLSGGLWSQLIIRLAVLGLVFGSLSWMLRRHGFGEMWQMVFNTLNWLLCKRLRQHQENV